VINKGKNQQIFDNIRKKNKKASVYQLKAYSNFQSTETEDSVNAYLVILLNQALLKC
jgi:hypothetical protein